MANTFTAISAGYNHSLAIKEDETVVAWGDNESGQSRIPAGLKAKAISAGGFYSLVLKEDGTVVGLGDNEYGQCRIPAGLKAKAISAGRKHSLALKEDGTVVAWGDNGYGLTDIPAGLKAKAISAGSKHSLALKEDGTVVAWGNSEDGQTNIPAGLTNVKAISAGEAHSLALKEDGTVVAWGDNGYGQTDIPAGLKAKAISAGAYFTLALKEDGTVVAWGYDADDETDIPAGLKAKAISAGGFHSLVLKEDGTVVGLGNNDDDQLDIPVNTQPVMPAVQSTASTTLPRLSSASNIDTSKYKLDRGFFSGELETIKIPNKVFDISIVDEVPLVDFLLENQGDALVFVLNGKLVGTSKYRIQLAVESGEDIVYECTKKIPYNPPHNWGKFGYKDIYSQKYVRLRLNGNYLITFENSKDFLESQNQFVKLEKGEKKLKYIASRLAVAAGSALIGANHCQEDTNTPLYKAIPFQPELSKEDEDEEEEEDVEEPKIYIQIGVERIDIPYGDGTVGYIKEEISRKKELDLKRIRLILLGKELQDNTEKVKEGSIVFVMMKRENNSEGGGKRRRLTNKKTHPKKRKTHRRRKMGTRTHIRKRSMKLSVVRKRKNLVGRTYRVHVHTPENVTLL